MPFDIKPNEDYLKFLSVCDKKNNYVNVHILLNLEKDYPGIFTKVMSNFNEVKQYRITLNELGNPIKLSWEEALKNYYFSNKYTGITEENKDIAKIFAEKSISQITFELANELRLNAKNDNIPNHILGKPLKEDTVQDLKRKLKNKELVDKESMEKLKYRQFTYEWLDKTDPRNAIIGIYTSCCGTITNQFYGRFITKSSILAPDVQNLVVRDLKGEIIAKGTLYVNKEKGYGVINDFEINDKYKRHEREIGIYKVDENNIEEKQREKIFKAFKRGIADFIIEYNIQNPKKPLTQLNVGMGSNKLKKQMNRFQTAEYNLKVPPEYCFKDASMELQHVLYKKQIYKEEEAR